MCTSMQEIIDEERKQDAIETVKYMYSQRYSLKIAHDSVIRFLTLDEVEAIYSEDDKKQTSSTASSQYTRNFT